MEVVSFKPEYLPEMAGLFVQNFRRLRSSVPILPDLMEDIDHITGMLGTLAETCPGIVALEGGRVVGYMSWFLVDDIRRTERRGAYCPEFGHSAVEGRKAEVYRTMYRAAAQLWTESGCQVHCLTLLAHDPETEKVWFWNGFGMVVVDAIRSLQPIERQGGRHVTVRKATPDDVEQLVEMEVAHWQHYVQPPILMEAYKPYNSAALEQFLGEEGNTIWLAMDGKDYVGYQRFKVNNTDCARIVRAPDTVSNTGAYVRPEYRGRGAATDLLNAAMQHYAAQGFQRCSLDFESFNPEATVFWLRYFEPVCLSVLRVPERRI